MKPKKRNTRSLDWKLKKYSRWIRLYMKRVRAVESDLGGEIESC